MATDILSPPDQADRNLHTAPQGGEKSASYGDKPLLAAARSESKSEPFDPRDIYRPGSVNLKNVDWVVVLWMAGMHVGALAAPFFFTWSAFGVFLLMHWMTCSIGICLGYHRYLSHKSFKLAPPARFAVLFCGAISGQGSPLMWSASHRLHHAKSDDEGDPHSPLHGKWWSHLVWLFLPVTKKQREQMFERFVPDLTRDRLMQFFERTYGGWLLLSGVVLYAVGGLPMLLWGLCVRMTVAYHSTWFVNSATHLWGYRNYQTKDESRNLWWVALVSYGEGWHNNHHAHPHVAPAGHRWWEIDMTWWAIKTLRLLRLASDVDDRIPERSGDKPAEQAA